MNYEVMVKQVDAQSIAIVRRRARPHQLAVVIPQACGEVWNFIRAAKVAGAGRHVAVYLDGAINIECGVEVTPSFVGGGDVYLSATPAGIVACTVLLHRAHGCVPASR
jgi:hypothetical protein